MSKDIRREHAAASRQRIKHLTQCHLSTCSLTNGKLLTMAAAYISVATDIAAPRSCHSRRASMRNCPH